jgi:hypothetical protein
MNRKNGAGSVPELPLNYLKFKFDVPNIFLDGLDSRNLLVEHIILVGTFLLYKQFPFR